MLTAIDHHPAQLLREELLVALGGPALPCLRAIDAVHRNPEALPAVRERLGHGDVAGALAVVEKLLGPAAVLRDGPLREELESAASRRVDHGLFRSGLVAVHPAPVLREAGTPRARGTRRQATVPARPPYPSRDAPQAEQPGPAPYRPALLTGRPPPKYLSLIPCAPHRTTPGRATPSPSATW
ncbi:hypothetical protein ACR6C2_10735 [Streptomyces sp. INA 01156]